MQLVKKLWHDPVWSKVIAGTIIVLGGAIWGYFHDWFLFINALLARVFVLALSNTSVPNWLLAILSAVTGLVIVVLAIIVWQLIFPTSNLKTWKSYTTDTFFGLKWRWKYFDDDGVYDLNSFCPHCDYQVYAGNLSAYRVVDHIGYQCESCGKILADFEMSLDALKNRIERNIHQKIRNGTWTR